MKNILITSLFIIGVLFSSPYEVGSLVEDFSGEYCFPENVGEWSLYDNLSENNGGNPLIIWLVMFDADNLTSRTEAPLTEYHSNQCTYAWNNTYYSYPSYVVKKTRFILKCDPDHT